MDEKFDLPGKTENSGRRMDNKCGRLNEDDCLAASRLSMWMFLLKDMANLRKFYT